MGMGSTNDSSDLAQLNVNKNTTTSIIFIINYLVNIVAYKWINQHTKLNDAIFSINDGIFSINDAIFSMGESENPPIFGLDYLESTNEYSSFTQASISCVVGYVG